MAILTGNGATEDRAGVIEIATDAEAFAGANVDRAITPDQLLAVVGQGVAAVAGGLVYRGVFDATQQLPDLSNALQGDFYKIDVAGAAFGQNFSVGDMLLINADMGGVIDNAKIDKIDNGESLAQLDDLTDVTILAPAQGQVLRYDGAGWVNEAISADDLAGDFNASNYTGGAAQSILIHLQGIDLELNNRADTVNSVSVVNGAVTIDGDDIVAPHTGVNYVAANTDTITTHLSGIDTKLGTTDAAIAALDLQDLTDVALTGTLSAGEVLRYSGAEWVDARLSSDDVDSDHTGVNYTQADNTVTGQLSGIDSELPNKADTINSVAVAGGAVTIDGDDIVAPHTGVNYTAANTDTVTTHFAGIDSELPNKADTVNSVAVVNGAVTIDGDDIVAPHTGVNYTGANTDTVTTHFAGIDTQLGNVATSINNIAAQNNNIALDADDLPADYLATNYTGLAADSVKTHLSGIDSELNNRADTVNSVAVVGGAVTIDSGDIVGDHAAANYSALNTDTITTHLAGIDSELNDRADTVNSVAVVNGAVTIDGDDMVAPHTGVNYAGANTDTVTTHFNLVDAKLGAIDGAIAALDLSSLTSVNLSGTLTDGEVMRYNGAQWVDARLATDDVDSDHAEVNYTAADAKVTSHLSGIDTELGALDTKIDNLTLNPLADVTISGTLTDGEVLRYNAGSTQWVDARLGTDDVDSGHAAVNYNAANDTVTAHLSGIDTELGSVATSINNIQAQNNNIALDADDLPSDYLATNYTGLAADSVKTHLSGIDDEFANRADTVNSVAVVAGAVTIDSDDIVAPRNGVQYSAANTDTITTHLAAIDTEFNDRASSVNAVNVVNGSVVIEADDIVAPVNPTNYTANNLDHIATHLGGIDTALGGKADTVNGVAVAAGSVTIDADDVVAPHTGVNYTAANTDTVLVHLQGIDSALAVAVSNAGIDDLQDVVLSATLSSGEVLKYNGANWVDAQLDYSELANTPTLPASSDDLTSDHAGVNYTGALNATLTVHLSGIDSELNNRADTVNSVAVVNGAVTIDSGDIVGDHTGVNYTALNSDTLSTHLSGIDTKLGTTDAAIAALDLDDLTSVSLSGTLSAGEVLRYSGAAWVDSQLDYSDLVNTPAIPSDSDDITTLHNAVNYTAVNTDTLTTHIAAIDSKIGTLEGAGSVDDVSTATNLVRGRLYQATNATDVTHTLPASANSEEGDKIRLYRSQAAGLVTIQQNGGDAGSIIRTAEGFVSSFTVNLVGEFVEIVFDADDTIWRVVQERAAYIEATITTTSDPYTVTRPNALFELDAAGTTRINVTLPAYSRLKSGDSFRFIVNADREVELNVAAADSGSVPFVLAGTNEGDQVVLNALAGQPFEVKCISSGGSDEFIVQQVLGTSSKYDVGTSANNVVQLDGTGKLPAVDGSQLINVAGGGAGFTFDRKAANFTASANYHYSISTSAGAVTMTLPAISAVGAGDQVRLFFRERGATNDITINVAAASGDLINGAGSFTMDIQYESYTFVANTTDSIWEVV